MAGGSEAEPMVEHRFKRWDLPPSVAMAVREYYSESRTVGQSPCLQGSRPKLAVEQVRNTESRLYVHTRPGRKNESLIKGRPV